MKISAVTLPTSCMAEAVLFYDRIGFELHRGGRHAAFTTFQVGEQHVNLRWVEGDVANRNESLVIFSVEDVDATYQFFIAKGLIPEFAPRDAEWGERYFHIRDPNGHLLSFAKRIN